MKKPYARSYVRHKRMKQKAIFLDKDGTLVPDIPYNRDVRKITLEKNVIPGLSLLETRGYVLVVISNQPGIAMGCLDENDISAIKEKITYLLLSNDIHVRAFYICPHGREDHCDCRKPMPGLLYRAAAELDIDLRNSWMIGDILNDVEAGNRAGCNTILIDNGNETQWEKGPFRTPVKIAGDLKEAAEFILEQKPAVS